MERGVIASPGIIIPQPGGFIMERAISKEEMRFYLMYWSKVVIPGNNLVYISVPEEEDLKACAAIERPVVQFQGMFQGDMVTQAILSCQERIASTLVSDKSVDWVLHQFGDSVALPAGAVVEKQTMRLDLLNVLPVPVGDVPIAEILEFKQRRSDELVELHDGLDSIYLSMLASPDQDLLSRKEIYNLRTAIKNLEAVQREKFSRTTKFDHSIEFSFEAEKIAKAMAGGAAVDLLTGGAIPFGMLAAGIASLLKVSFKRTVTYEAAKNKQKLAYLGKAAAEGYIRLPT